MYSTCLKAESTTKYFLNVRPVVSCSRCEVRAVVQTRFTTFEFVRQSGNRLEKSRSLELAFNLRALERARKKFEGSLYIVTLFSGHTVRERSGRNKK